MRAKRSNVLNHSVSELKNLVNDENSHVAIKVRQFHISLHPSCLRDIKSAVREYLDTILRTYDEKVNGIILGYRNVKILKDVGTIFNDDSFIHLDFEAELYVFAPVIGSELRGIVSKNGQEDIGCLVHRVFNVAIPRPSNCKRGEWCGASINVGQEITFVVDYLDLTSRLPYIRGKLLDIGSSDQQDVTRKVKSDITKETVLEEENLSLKEGYKKRKREVSEEDGIFVEKKRPKRQGGSNIIAAQPSDSGILKSEVENHLAELRESDSTSNFGKKEKSKKRVSFQENTIADLCNSSKTSDDVPELNIIQRKEKKKKKKKSEPKDDSFIDEILRSTDDLSGHTENSSIFESEMLGQKKKKKKKLETEQCTETLSAGNLLTQETYSSSHKKKKKNKQEEYSAVTDFNTVTETTNYEYESVTRLSAEESNISESKFAAIEKLQRKPNAKDFTSVGPVSHEPPSAECEIPPTQKKKKKKKHKESTETNFNFSGSSLEEGSFITSLSNTKSVAEEKRKKSKDLINEIDNSIKGMSCSSENQSESSSIFSSPSNAKEKKKKKKKNRNNLENTLSGQEDEVTHPECSPHSGKNATEKESESKIPEMFQNKEILKGKCDKGEDVSIDDKSDLFNPVESFSEPSPLKKKKKKKKSDKIDKNKMIIAVSDGSDVGVNVSDLVTTKTLSDRLPDEKDVQERFDKKIHELLKMLHVKSNSNLSFNHKRESNINHDRSLANMNNSQEQDIFTGMESGFFTSTQVEDGLRPYVETTPSSCKKKKDKKRSGLSSINDISSASTSLSTTGSKDDDEIIGSKTADDDMNSLKRSLLEALSSQFSPEKRENSKNIVEEKKRKKKEKEKSATLENKSSSKEDITMRQLIQNAGSFKIPDIDKKSTLTSLVNVQRKSSRVSDTPAVQGIPTHELSSPSSHFKSSDSDVARVKYKKQTEKSSPKSSAVINIFSPSSAKELKEGFESHSSFETKISGGERHSEIQKNTEKSLPNMDHLLPVIGAEENKLMDVSRSSKSCDSEKEASVNCGIIKQEEAVNSIETPFGKFKLPDIDNIMACGLKSASQTKDKQNSSKKSSSKCKASLKSPPTTPIQTVKHGGKSLETKTGIQGSPSRSDVPGSSENDQSVDRVPGDVGIRESPKLTKSPKSGSKSSSDKNINVRISYTADLKQRNENAHSNSENSGDETLSNTRSEKPSKLMVKKSETTQSQIQTKSLQGNRIGRTNSSPVGLAVHQWKKEIHNDSSLSSSSDEETSNVVSRKLSSASNKSEKKQKSNNSENSSSANHPSPNNPASSSVSVDEELGKVRAMKGTKSVHEIGSSANNSSFLGLKQRHNSNSMDDSGRDHSNKCKVELCGKSDRSPSYGLSVTALVSAQNLSKLGASDIIPLSMKTKSRKKSLNDSVESPSSCGKKSGHSGKSPTVSVPTPAPSFLTSTPSDRLFSASERSTSPGPDLSRILESLKSPLSSSSVVQSPSQLSENSSVSASKTEQKTALEISNLGSSVASEHEDKSSEHKKHSKKKKKSEKSDSSKKKKKKDKVPDLKKATSDLLAKYLKNL